MNQKEITKTSMVYAKIIIVFRVITYGKIAKDPLISKVYAKIVSAISG